MRLHENRDLFTDALQAASQPVEDGGLGIKSMSTSFMSSRTQRL